LTAYIAVGGMMGVTLPHTIHLHRRQFQVPERYFDPAFAANWASPRDGVTDKAW